MNKYQKKDKLNVYDFLAEDGMYLIITLIIILLGLMQYIEGGL